jgi:hypothetical protein
VWTMGATPDLPTSLLEVEDTVMNVRPHTRRFQPRSEALPCSHGTLGLMMALTKISRRLWR